MSQESEAILAIDAMNMLRTVQQHHVALSQMADIKANILIGAASVVFALVIRDNRDGVLALTSLILGATSLIAVGLCVFAVIPKTGTPRGRANDANVLFFGAFGAMHEAEFQTRMRGILTTNEGVHEAMIRDIHQLGVVLRNKKYRFLAWGYQVFLAGLAVALAVYAGQQLPNLH